MNIFALHWWDPSLNMPTRYEIQIWSREGATYLEGVHVHVQKFGSTQLPRFNCLLAYLEILHEALEGQWVHDGVLFKIVCKICFVYICKSFGTLRRLLYTECSYFPPYSANCHSSIPMLLILPHLVSLTLCTYKPDIHVSPQQLLLIYAASLVSLLLTFSPLHFWDV